MKKLLLVFLIPATLISCSKGGDGDPDPQTPDPSGTNQQDIAAVDNAVAAFMTRYAIPGVSIAVSKNEKLVYVKSYGNNGATDNSAVTNKSLYRIASISKPITAVGIMKLLEAGKLNMDSKIFGQGGILHVDYPSAPSNLHDITVRDLLHHTVGSWGNDGNDPMFKQPNYNHKQLIDWTLANYPAASNRGTYRYSNFGYSLLGRVIEKLSGKSYEQFIKDEVLKPSGITTMTMAGNSKADRKPNEVLYTGQGGFDPYAYNVTRMDAHGGWLASATDLLRFMAKVDGFAAKADILKAATVQTMMTRSVPSSNYASGWGVNNAGHWWHMGSLPGTATILIRAANGFSWAILCNSNSTAANFSGELDNLLWPLVNNTATPWQNIDQF